MTVIDAFNQWYSQLHPNDQQALCVFLVEWLGAKPTTQARQANPRFGGRTAPPVTARTVGGPRIIRCQKCGAENEI